MGLQFVIQISLDSQYNMQAKRDQNRITTLLGALNTDGITPTIINANPSTHRLSVSGSMAGVSGSMAAPRDENRVTVVMGVSSVDGITPVPIYSDSLYNLLITNQ